jgi:hypothetical protein
MEEMRNTYKILGGKSEGKRSPGRSRRIDIWEDNIKKDLKYVLIHIRAVIAQSV